MSLLFAEETENLFRYADIIVPLNIPNTLTYGIPTEIQGTISLGMRVEVAIGKNKLYSGIVLRVHNHAPETYQVKPIKRLIDKAPILHPLHLKFWQWISSYYMASLGEVMQGALPAHLKLMGETKLVWREEHKEEVAWSDEAILAIDALDLRKEITLTELKALIGAQHLSSVLQELIEQEVVWINEQLEEPYRPKKETIVTLQPQYKDQEQLSNLFESLKKAPKQETLLLAYLELAIKQTTVKQNELLSRANATTTILKSLQEKGVFTIEQQVVDRIAASKQEHSKTIQFTQAQETALAAINEDLVQKSVVLLEGVTGSGKTLLYIHKIREVLADGKQVLLLLPEIGLTTHLVEKLYAYFGDTLGVYHSRFSNNERVEIWEKVKSKKQQLIVGPRSALWLPYDQLGLIIIDEEHDASYKQKDPAPRFHARDAAIYLASLHQAKVLLGSATPSLESLYNAQQDKYGYVTLQERYQGVSLPTINIVHATSIEQQSAKHIKHLTPTLIQAIHNTLQEKKQVILFQNRRGYAPFQLCTVCGWIPHCHSCAVSLTYHKVSDKMHCHYCGMKTTVIRACHNCGSNSMQSKSFGTERIEEEVRALFPKATVARMDIDNMRGKHAMKHLLEQIENRQIDILVGTQMVVKGLDFANITLVGILQSDSLLNYPDFRVNERAFQLMEQVSGRAGRVDGKGNVIIQAYNINHPVLQWVKEHQSSAFYQEELKNRATFLYPPFSRLIKITFKHSDEAKCLQAATLFQTSLKTIPQIIVQGPVPALVSKVRNQYLQEVWIKCMKDSQLLATVKMFALQEKQRLTSSRGLSNVQVIFDVDPM